MRKWAISAALAIALSAVVPGVTTAARAAEFSATGFAVSLDLQQRLTIHAVDGVGGQAEYQVGAGAPVSIVIDCAAVFRGFEGGAAVFASGATVEGQRYYLFVGDEWLEYYGYDRFAVSTTPNPGGHCDAPWSGERGSVWLF